MNKKLKRLSILLISILLIVSLLPTTAFAAGKIDTDRLASLSIYYQNSGKLIIGAKFDLYKVATVDAYSRMTLTEAFDPLKDKISGLADLESTEDDEAWRELARTLKSYESDFSGALLKSDTIGNDGNLKFDELECGLYLVIGSRKTIDGYRYTADPFMVFLPGIDKTQNEWVYDYDISVEPKSSRRNVPSDDDTVTRKVLKDWEPKEGVDHPSEVKVQLLRDGEAYETVTLSEKNNWRYTWSDLSDRYDWDVCEVDVPDNYTVKISRSGITFTIINKYVVPIIGTNLPIQKRITGDKPKTDSTFTFVFSPKDVSCPMPAGSNGTVKEITITGAGSKEIGEIPFENPGKYVYTVSEKNGGIEGYTYDSTVYTVTFEVTEKDGELFITKTVKDSKGNKAAAIEFTNPYKTPGQRIPQTGVLWWPVPLLLCAGFVFVMVGVIRRRRCN